MVNAIFGFCDIRNFTDCTEVFRDCISSLINCISGSRAHVLLSLTLSDRCSELTSSHSSTASRVTCIPALVKTTGPPTRT